MEIELLDMDTNGEKNSNIKSLPKNSDCSKEKNKKKNNISKKKDNKNYIIIIIISIILLSIIILSIKLKRNNKDLIDNNFEKNKGIIELTSKAKDTIKIKKELLQNINSFISCLGQPGTGKSTFGSNYYKKLYRVKNDYFESSDGVETFTKGIWMITDEERRKIPEYINRDFLDVEGFQIDDPKSWKYIMIIAFLSTDLIILNNKPRYDEVKKMIKIIEKSLKKMQQLNIPRILKVIYIQTNKKVKKQIPIEELLEKFKYDKDIFKMIKFQYVYLPFIPTEEKEKDLLKYSKYKKNFEKILNLLNSTNKYNSVASLMNYIDSFNDAINGNTIFNNQTILKDIEIDFNGVYSKYENKLKIELYQKMTELIKFVKLNETFEDFINKQINLIFEFEINNEDFTFYGSSNAYDEFYEELKKKKTFRIEPRDIFLDLFNTEILRLESQKNERQQIIYNIYIQKKNEIDKYFALLKFDQEIGYMDLELKIDTDQIDYKLEREKDLKNYFNEKKREKKKEWEDQIQRAKWKTVVAAFGEMKCENGHDFANNFVHCGKCEQPLYWVDSDEKYAICKGCNEVTKLTGHLVCSGCGAPSKAHVKWIKGYRP